MVWLEVFDSHFVELGKPLYFFQPAIPPRLGGTADGEIDIFGSYMAVSRGQCGNETDIGRKPGRKVGKGSGHKMAVMSLVERGGSVRSFHVDDVTGKTIAAVLGRNVSPEAHLRTDEWATYKALGWNCQVYNRLCDDAARPSRQRQLSHYADDIGARL